jgi:hypothetical protein
MKFRTTVSVLGSCLIVPAWCALIPLAQAATLVSEGHAAGAQCVGTDVNDSGVVVGACAPNNATGPVAPWVAVTTGTEISLPVLAAGQACVAAGIDNTGVITGACTDAADKTVAVRWSAGSPGSGPTTLSPLSGVLGIGTDVASVPTGYNQSGATIGQSISANGTGNATAVIWLAGSTVATPVSTANDNCAAVDVSDSLISGKPVVAVNCPNSVATNTAKVGRATGLLGAYVLSNLPVPAGYSYCSVAMTNAAQQFIGTCHTAAPDAPKSAFWSSYTAPPNLTTGTTRNGGMYLNDSGHAVIGYQTSSGQGGAAFWIPTSGALTVIPPLTGGTHISARGLGNNDLVILNSDIVTENVEAALWTPTGGTVAGGFEGGGQASSFISISKSGNYGVGDAVNSAHNVDAVRTVLP